MNNLSWPGKRSKCSTGLSKKKKKKHGVIYELIHGLNREFSDTFVNLLKRVSKWFLTYYTVVPWVNMEFGQQLRAADLLIGSYLALTASSLVKRCLFRLYPVKGRTKRKIWGAPEWLSRLSVRLRLRSRSRGPRVRAPRRALGWWLRAWSLLPILCFPLSLPLLHSCSVSLCLKNE